MTAKNEQKSTDADLERERLKSLVNSMGDGVIAIDQQLKIVLNNGAALNILDSNESLPGKSIATVLRLIDKNNQPVNLKKTLSSLKTPLNSRDWKIKYTDGSQASLYISIAPVNLGYGQHGLKGFVLLLRDITHEKSLEEERDEFISVVSHELRTPIAIAEGNIGNAEFIFEKSDVQNKDISDMLRRAHEQILFLASMINDLSTLSRAERGKLVLDIQDINAHHLVEDLASDYKKQAAEKSLVIKTDLDPHLEVLKSSKLYVREVLQNFVTNALKYTQKGHITIGAKAKPKGIEFYVADTGIGISKSDQSKVFDKFFRSENYKTHESSGTGLGLYVTMKLARILHADISIKSEITKGTTFTVFIPNLNDN